MPVENDGSPGFAPLISNVFLFGSIFSSAKKSLSIDVASSEHD